jgi:hypothetical protein
MELASVVHSSLVRSVPTTGAAARSLEVAGQLRAAIMEGDDTRIARLLSDLLRVRGLTKGQRVRLQSRALLDLVHSLRRSRIAPAGCGGALRPGRSGCDRRAAAQRGGSALAGGDGGPRGAAIGDRSRVGRVSPPIRPDARLTVSGRRGASPGCDAVEHGRAEGHGRPFHARTPWRCAPLALRPYLFSRPNSTVTAAPRSR